MELTLKLLSGRRAGQEIKVPGQKFLIGRAEDCNLRPHSDLISRHHCVLLVEEGFCAIRDFGSKNGTQVNAEPVVGQRELHNGDRLTIGNLDFEVQLSSSVGGKRRPKVKDVKDAALRTAAGTVRGDVDDVSDWLTDSADDGETKRVDPAAAKRPPHETPALGISNRETTFMKSVAEETTTIKPPESKSEPPNDLPTEGGAERGVAAARKLFGEKLVAARQNAPKNSHEAAADALKKFFNNRKP